MREHIHVPYPCTSGTTYNMGRATAPLTTVPHRYGTTSCQQFGRCLGYRRYHVSADSNAHSATPPPPDWFLLSMAITLVAAQKHPSYAYFEKRLSNLSCLCTSHPPLSKLAFAIPTGTCSAPLARPSCLDNDVLDEPRNVVRKLIAYFVSELIKGHAHRAPALHVVVQLRLYSWRIELNDLDRPLA